MRGPKWSPTCGCWWARSHGAKRQQLGLRCRSPCWPPPSTSLWRGPGAHVTWLEKAASFSLQVSHIIDIGGGEREAVWSLPLWILVCPYPFLLTSGFSSQVQALLTCSPFRPPTEPQRHPPKDFSTSSHQPHNKSLIPYHSDWLCLPHDTLTDSHSSSQETGFQPQLYHRLAVRWDITWLLWISVLLD